MLIQAHPYRRKRNLLDVAYLDGVEVNSHPLYRRSDFEEMLANAKENGLILTCGGDYHADTYRPRCGTFLPDTLADGTTLGTYLTAADAVMLRIHEPGKTESCDYLYERARKDTVNNTNAV